ncbi:MAG: alanine racemase [Acidobacteria bacterium]|nr:alanine racemase [Acidobacteriota bacterium]
MRQTFAEIDLSAIRHNASAFRDLIAPSELCAVVKADGYGHGDVPVANAALDAGATRLAVALVEEGIRLREAGVDVPILILSEPDLSSATDIAQFDLTPTVYSVRAIEGLDSVGTDINVHLKIDTGMHRVGASPQIVHDLAEAVADSKRIKAEGVFTHFPVADEDPRFTNQQIDEFESIIAGLDIPLVHMANTAGAVLFPDARRDFCRVGLGLYGLHPCDETRDVFDLRPAMKILSHVSHVQQLEVGARPSYGRIKALERDSTVVTVPIGYADGYSRRLTRYGSVLIGGQRFPLAGAVTMDQIVVDVGDADVEIGDEVVLMGSQGGAEISADELAETLETITHEIVCKIGARVPRRYVG